ncbi:hypothetical protein AC579_7790 [Pseudocercospora musae]|uniref:Uncharacterized protein n=1 Tax=Pseudocercospora musae TaxID=113226 RepID=A0A139IJA0_9PEZI|nr:hypothetical protein AC579_7790 [Pseudocercospora musae]
MRVNESALNGPRGEKGRYAPLYDSRKGKSNQKGTTAADLAGPGPAGEKAWEGSFAADHASRSVSTLVDKADKVLQARKMADLAPKAGTGVWGEDGGCLASRVKQRQAEPSRSSTGRREQTQLYTRGGVGT